MKYKQGTGGSALGNLADDTAYFVIKGEDGRIKLASSAENAALGTAIDLDGLGSGDAHVLERTGKPDITFDPDGTRAELTAPSGINTGDAVKYHAEGGTAIGGLTNDTTYFAIVQDNGKLKLAETRDKALSGEAIALTDLRYWSVPLQEPYATAEIAIARHRQTAGHKR